MPRELSVDRAIYVVDDAARSYEFARRNPDWKSLSRTENEDNKRQLDGYTRLFRDGHQRVFHYGSSGAGR